MNELLKIGNKYQSTKSKNGFLEIYFNYFNVLKDKEINILEIGVDKGESLKIWREYFSKAKICGVDINFVNFNIQGVDIIKADQTNLNDLKNICKKYKNFDIIIDDGGHHSKQIITSFKFLFHYLNDGGFYVVEDLQTSYFPRFGGSRYNLNRKNTSINYFKSIIDSINYEKNNKPFYKNSIYDGLIKYIHFYQNILIVKKGRSINYYYENSVKSNFFFNYLKKLFFSFF